MKTTRKKATRATGRGGGPALPAIITQANAAPILAAIAAEPYFDSGLNKVPRPAWTSRPVYLEFPEGELIGDWMKRIALVGRSTPEIVYGARDGVAKQGIENMVRVRRPLFEALMALDLLPPHRGRIVTSRENPIDWNRYVSGAADLARRGYKRAAPHVSKAARAAGRATVAATKAAARATAKGARKATKATARGLGPLARRAGDAMGSWGRKNKPPRKAKRAAARRRSR